MTLALIHTSATLVPVFQDLCKKYLADIDTFNIVDDSLIKYTIRAGTLLPETARRVVDYVASAEAAGADQVLVTCSSIGAAVETAAGLSKVPVLRVDQPMADLAVATGKRIGVVATLPTTLGPTSDLVARRAIVAGKQIELSSVLCEGAFEALMGGNPDLHDAKVKAALLDLIPQVDVVVLAQASMARVVAQLDEADKKVPILSSPELAIQTLAERIKQNGRF